METDDVCENLPQEQEFGLDTPEASDEEQNLPVPAPVPVLKPKRKEGVPKWQILKKLTRQIPKKISRQSPIKFPRQSPKKFPRQSSKKFPRQSPVSRRNCSCSFLLYRVLCMLLAAVQFGLAGQLFGCVFSIFAHDNYYHDCRAWQDIDVTVGVCVGVAIGIFAGMVLSYNRLMVFCVLVCIGTGAVAGQMLFNSHEFGMIMGVG